jgi:hypothetical protein
MNIIKYFLITIFISISAQASNSLYLSCDVTSNTITIFKNNDSTDGEIEKLKLMVELSFFPDNSLLSFTFESNNPKVNLLPLINLSDTGMNPKNYSTDSEWLLKNTTKEGKVRIDTQVKLNRFTGGIAYSYIYTSPEGMTQLKVTGNCNKVDLKKKF